MLTCSSIAPDACTQTRYSMQISSVVSILRQLSDFHSLFACSF